MNLLDGWLGFALSVVSLSVGIGGATWGLALAATLRRRVLSLEFDVADLQERLLREIKSRAGKLGVKAKQEDEEFASLLLDKNKQQPTKPEPWWMQHVHQDLKQ